MHSFIEKYCPFFIFQHGGGMNHGDNPMMSDGFRPTSDAFSQHRVNLLTQWCSNLNSLLRGKTFIVGISVFAFVSNSANFIN